jgi:Phosphomannomutase
MKPEKVFKRYDIRGRYPEELDEEFAKRLGKALAVFVRENFNKRIVVCRDNKQSSVKLKQSIVKGLTSSGLKVIDIGEGPTDYAAYLGKKHSCISVQVTSSHMPLEFNGFKFMYPEGNGFTNDDLSKVKTNFRQTRYMQGDGDVEKVASTSKRKYKDNLKMTAMRNSSATVNKKIVVDTMGGATREILPELLDNLGAEVIDISDEKEEMPYRDPPNPKPELLDELKQKVEEEDADLGLATDMDGDRVRAYYNGEFLTGDEVFCIIGQLVGGDSVASVDTSNALEDMMQERGNKVFYTRVGDPFVMRKAVDESVAFAGEPNGHYSVTEFIPYNSGTLSCLMLAGTDIQEKLDEIPFYSVQRDNLGVEEKEEVMASVREQLDQGDIISQKDGVKAKFGYSEVLIRPSGSSQKIRLISEAEDEDTAQAGLEEAKKLIQK